MPEKLPFEFVLTPEFAADPYAAYGAIRARGPVHPIDFPPGFQAGAAGQVLTSRVWYGSHH